jgi:LacI family transcriptional regulator
LLKGASLMEAAPTLRDIAAQAGVSIGTASQALNNRPNVSPETRARVLQAASTLGYHVREPKSRAAERKLAVVGLLIKHDYEDDEPPLANPFYTHVQAGVEQACRRAGLSMMLAGLEVDRSNRPVIWPAMIQEQRVDGLLLAGAFLDGSLAQIRQRLPVPTVLIDAYAPGRPFDSVVIDNVEGARAAVAHLIALGHRAIAVIGCHDTAPLSFQERRKGYRQALREAGIAEQYCEPTGPGRQGAYEAALRVLCRTPRPSAIFACNDEIALGVIRAAHSLDLHIPRDLSIVGFDNIELACELQPALTTVHVHKNWMGLIGLRLLLERVQNPDQPHTTTVVGTKLIIRESTSPPAYSGEQNA